MIAIIKGVGTNIASIQHALDRIQKPYVYTDDHAVIKNASHVLLPGVGHAARGMQQLRERGYDQLIPSLMQPVLGVCLGMQLLFEASEEGDVECLKIIPGKIRKLKVEQPLTVPHMGWNKINFVKSSGVIDREIPANNYVYFVHSYCAPVSDATIATVDYQQKFSAIVQHNNFFGMQFHPERSGQVGQQLLLNFLALK